MANKSINKYNVAAINQSGKVGTIRYYQRGGETYVRLERSMFCIYPFAK